MSRAGRERVYGEVDDFRGHFLGDENDDLRKGKVEWAVELTAEEDGFAGVLFSMSVALLIIRAATKLPN